MNAPLRFRQPRIELPKLRKSAQGKPCTLRSEWCNGNTETTVWCHSNFSEHGKGMGLKSHDIFGFYGCSDCHTYFDLICKQESIPATERRLMFYGAMSESLILAQMEGVL